MDSLFSSVASQLSIFGDEVDNVLTKMKESKVTVETLSNGRLQPRDLFQYGVENLEDARLILSTALKYSARGDSLCDQVDEAKVHLKQHHLVARQGSGLFDLDIAENEVPDIRSLSQALVSIYSWESLGVKLGVGLSKLQEIKQACNDDLEMCKVRLYDLWLRQNTNPSWKDIVDALEKMEENNLASKIKRSLCHLRDGDINPKPFIVKQISADSPNVSRDILSTDSDSGKNVNPNLFVLHVPVPMNIPLPVTPSVASMPQTSANPVASGQHNTPSNDAKLIDLLRSMTIEDSQQIGINCRVYNVSDNTLIQSNKPPLTRDIKLKQHPHPRVQEYSSDAVPIGTEIRLEIVADSSCYLYILNIGTSGKASLLLPNELDPTNYFSANQTYFLPEKNCGFIIEGPCGKETIQILAFSKRQNSYEKLVVEPIRERELYRDISVRRKKPISYTEKKGFVQVQFDVQ